MAFRDVRLPTAIELGAKGGLGFKTTIQPLTNGRERRNVDRETMKGEWDLAYGVKRLSDLASISAFHKVVRGRADTFRFKDHGDYWVDELVDDEFTGTPQPIGVGDASETDFQIVKTYEFGAYTSVRTITKPVDGTTRVFLDDVEQETGWDVDLLTGIVSLDTPPGVGVEVGVVCQFDVPVRFDVDRIEVSMVMFDKGSYPQILVVEVDPGDE